MAGGHGLNFVEALVGSDYETIGSALVATGLISVIVLVGKSVVTKALAKSHTDSNALVPDSKLSCHAFLDVLISFLRSLSDSVMGRENRKHLPFVGSLFFFLFFMNLLGLIPGFSAPTDSLVFNLGVAAVVFLYYNFWGLKEVGLKNYLKHMWGPIWWAGFLLFPIELISHFVRPLSLSLRLFGNMTGDHIVLSVFTDLTKVIIPVIFYGLGTFVCFMQAFVFTLLTMVYIRFAVAHEHDEHGHDEHKSSHGGVEQHA